MPELKWRNRVAQGAHGCRHRNGRAAVGTPCLLGEQLPAALSAWHAHPARASQFQHVADAPDFVRRLRRLQSRRRQSDGRLGKRRCGCTNRGLGGAGSNFKSSLVAGDRLGQVLGRQQGASGARRAMLQRPAGRGLPYLEAADLQLRPSTRTILRPVHFLRRARSHRGPAGGFSEGAAFGRRRAFFSLRTFCDVGIVTPAPADRMAAFRALCQHPEIERLVTRYSTRYRARCPAAQRRSQQPFFIRLTSGLERAGAQLVAPLERRAAINDRACA